MATVLVVDDEPAILKLIATVLQAEHSVITAESAIEALTLFESYHDRIDVIITDVMMPGMTGLQLVERLESTHRRRFPVLFVTGASDYPIDPCRVVLPKPFSPSVLRDLVRGVLETCKNCPDRL
jgi:CheY-like chemotaxis protein